MAVLMAKTRAYSKAILDQFLGGIAAPTAGTPLTIALYPADPGPDMTASGEITAGGYVRMPFQVQYRIDPSSGLWTAYTFDPVLWPAATVPWGTVGGLAIWAQGISFALYRGAFDTPQTVSAGNQFAIGAGDLIIGEG